MYGSNPSSPNNNKIYGLAEKDPSLIIDFDADYNVQVSNNRVSAWTDRIKGITVLAPSLVTRPSFGPGYDGNNFVTFDQNTYLRFKGRITELEDISEFTLVMVCSGIGLGNYSTSDRCGFQYGVETGSSILLGLLSTASTVSLYNINGYMRNRLATNYQVAGADLGSQIAIITMVYNGKNSNDDRIKISMNGGTEFIPTTVNTIRTTTFKPLANEKCSLLIGAGFAGGDPSPNGWSGKISKIQIYKRALSRHNLLDVIDQIKSEKRLRYKRQIMCMGDSRTAGTAHTSTASWPEQLQNSLGSAFAVYNCGLDGDTIANALTVESNRVISTLDTFQKQIVIVWYGFNDHALSAASAATIYANLLTYCQDLKTASPNFVVIICTELPTTDATWNTKRATINASIAAELSPPWDYICDLAANTTIGDDADASNVTYYSDGVHPTFAGDEIISSIAYNIVNVL